MISNHDDLRRMVEWHEIPYHHVPVSKENKAEAFAHIDELFQQYETDVVVLARYMQILPAELCGKYSGKVIKVASNIVGKVTKSPGLYRNISAIGEKTRVSWCS